MSESEKSWVHKLFFNAYFEDALAKYRAQTGFGESYAILNALNEYWFQIGVMSKEGYEYNRKRYGVSLTEKLKKELEAEQEAQKKADLQQQKPIVTSKRPDYFNMTDDQLLDQYLFAQKVSDTTAIQLIQYAAMRRGYKFTPDGKIVNIKGEKVLE
ncbi:MAG: hypothetical protein QXH40_00040 [Candidatus Bathyarchaeia archaeon]